MTDDIHSMVIASDYRVPDPTKVWPLLERRKSDLAGIGAHHVLVYMSTHDDGRVLVMIGVHSREPIVELLLRHYGPLLQRWKLAGRLYADLDPGSVVQWLHATTLFLLAPSWRPRSATDKPRFVEQFLVRALVPQIRQ